MQRSLLDLNNEFLIEPIKFSTLDHLIAPTSFAISPSQARVEVEETLQLSITDVTPEGADTSVTWTSSNEGAATVNESGIVTGVSSSDQPITITATSKFSGSVQATATIFVDPASPKYNPSFEKIVDPFGNVDIYMTTTVRNETRVFDYVELTARRLDRSTGELDPDYGESYATLREDINNRQKITFVEEEFDNSGLYQITIEGYIPDTEIEDPDTGSMVPAGNGELVTLYVGNHDFAEVPATIAGQDFHTNQLYLRQTYLTDAEGNYIGENYDAYIDIASGASGIRSITRAGGNGSPLHIGLYPTTGDDFTYESRQKFAEFVVDEIGVVVPIDVDTTYIYSYETYVFVIFENTSQGATAADYTEMFRNEIDMNTIARAEQSAVQELAFEKEIDPFGATSVYCQLTSRGSLSISNGYFEFTELDPDTKEEGDSVYCSLGEADLSNRNLMQFTDGEFDPNGYYKYSFSVTLVDSSGTTSYPYLVKDGVIDFSTVPSTVVDDSTNGFYLQKCDVTDADGYAISAYHHYNGYLSFEEEVSVEAGNIMVGVFSSDTPDDQVEYRSNDMITAFTMVKTNQIQEQVALDPSEIDETETYIFAVFVMQEGTQTFEKIFTKVINLDAVSYFSRGFVGNISLELSESYYGHYQFILTLGGSMMDTLTDGWNVSVYQNGDEIYPAENIFNSYGTTGEKYSYTFEDPEDDLFYQALTSDEDEKEIWITAEFPTDTDPETIAVAKLTNVVPSDFANPDYIDGCAEFSYAFWSLAVVVLPSLPAELSVS